MMILRYPPLHSITWLLALAWISQTLAHRIEIEPGEKHCFFENLSPKDRMSVTYEVSGSSVGHLDIDFFATDPTGKVFYSQYKQPTGSLSMEASSSGRYTYCFDNSISSYAVKQLSFNVHGVLYTEEDEHIAPVEQEIRELSSSLQLVKDEQAYLVSRERTHRDTAESTNSRVKWWAIVQTIILFSVCAWNVQYLKSWFEIKRMA